MSIFSWLNKKLGHHPVDPETLELANLKLKDILDTHREWKDDLLNLLDNGDSQQINLDWIKSDHYCTQGKWLYGPGQQFYRDFPEYQIALESHAEFHQSATHIVEAYQKGNKDIALGLLETTFRHASNKNQQDLTRLLSAVNNNLA